MIERENTTEKKTIFNQHLERISSYLEPFFQVTKIVWARFCCSAYIENNFVRNNTPGDSLAFIMRRKKKHLSHNIQHHLSIYVNKTNKKIQQRLDSNRNERKKGKGTHTHNPKYVNRCRCGCVWIASLQCSMDSLQFRNPRNIKKKQQICTGLSSSNMINNK